ncbi:MAG: glyceraldehyde-3-phosphate dehydrogenase [Bacteroidia bacterium]
METKTLNKPTNSFEAELSVWIEQEKAAIELIRFIGQFWYEKSIELVLFRNQLIDRSVSEILNFHNYANSVVKKPITIYDTLSIAKEIANLNLAPARIDIGKLAFEWIQEKTNFSSQADFLRNKLTDFIGEDKKKITPKDVILYGFGRIGRLAARELIAQAGKGEQLRLRAIVTRDKKPEDIIKRANLLRMDSVHGPFPGTIIEDIENQTLIINGHTVKMISANNPEEIDYTSYGINNALLIDNTGVFRDAEELSRHLKSKGVDKVLLTAPAKGDVPNIVHGVNHNSADIDSTKIWSAASCTTNAIVPPLFVMENTFGIEKGHIETIHSYTNDQNLLDNYHKKYRRGRSAALNMVITETGAESAIKKTIPQLSGKITANSVRVPTPNVSLAIINITLKRATSKEEVNEVMKNAALNGDLVEQIQYSTFDDLVSTDVIGNPCPSVFDSQATQVSSDGKTAILYVWYDNEYGYTRQVIRLSKHISKVRRLTYY